MCPFTATRENRRPSSFSGCHHFCWEKERCRKEGGGAFFSVCRRPSSLLGPRPPMIFSSINSGNCFPPPLFPNTLRKGKCLTLSGEWREGGQRRCCLDHFREYRDGGSGGGGKRPRVIAWTRPDFYFSPLPPPFPHVVFPPKISLSLSILLGRARAEGGKAGVVARLPPQETFTQDPPPPVCHNVRHFFHYGKKKVLPSFFRFRKNPTVAFSS